MRRRAETFFRRRYVSVVAVVLVCAALLVNRRFLSGASAAPSSSVEDPVVGVPTRPLATAQNPDHSSETGAESSDATGGMPSLSPAVQQCVDSLSNVLLVGNRPVGTYLCSYFPQAVALGGGCRLPCAARGKNFTVTIVALGSREQLRTADVVVNHHGPVPTKFSPMQPVLTVFYSGESNASEGKKALHSYQTKYDVAISFHTHRPLYFTWTNRYKEDFQRVLAGQWHAENPPWATRRSAVAIMVSRCKKGGREAIIQGLAPFYPVHSFGKCHRTHRVEQEFPQCASIAGGRYPQKMCVLKQYKFVLALDNSRESDYVTEKVYHALLAGAIPIYDGAPNADEYLPGGWTSVIRLSAFATGSGGVVDFRRLGEALKRIDENEAERHPYQQWTDATHERVWGDTFVDHLHHEEPTCQLCDQARLKKCGHRG